MASGSTEDFMRALSCAASGVSPRVGSHGEPDNEVQVKMLAHFCEKAAQGDEMGRIGVEKMGPELRDVLDRLGVYS